jgi:oligoendopeptidase F
MGWDVDNLPITLDLYPRAGKNTHGFCSNIDAGKDARILMNADNNLNSLDTLCHELGHAVYDLGISTKLPYFDRTPASSAITEAVAMMMGEIFINEDILSDTTGVPQKVMERISDSNVDKKAGFVRSYAMFLNFEKSLYENPDQNIAELYKNLSVKYLNEAPEAEANNHWATIPHFLTHPGYLQNYLRADIMAQQIYDAATEELGPLSANPNTAEYFNKNLFRTGSTYDENETLRRFTGKGFSIDAYKKQFKK